MTWVNDSVFTAFMQNSTGPQRQRIIDALQLRNQPLITTDLPSTVPLHVWLHGNGPMLSVQIANADLRRLCRSLRELEAYRARNQKLYLVTLVTYLIVCADRKTGGAYRKTFQKLGQVLGRI